MTGYVHETQARQVLQSQHLQADRTPIFGLFIGERAS